MIKEVTPEVVNVKPEKTGTNKKGESWTMWPVGIQVKSKWYNAAFFKMEEVNQIQKDKPIVLDFFQEEYQGTMYSKFKIPNKTDLMEHRIAVLEEAVKKLQVSQNPIPQHPGNSLYAGTVPDNNESYNDDLPF